MCSTLNVNSYIISPRALDHPIAITRFFATGVACTSRVVARTSIRTAGGELTGDFRGWLNKLISRY